MSKKLLVLMLLAFVSLANAQSKGKSKGKNAESEALPEPEKSQLDSLMGYAMYEGMTPFEALDYQLPPEFEVDPVTNKKTVFKEVIKKNDSIRTAFRKEYRKRNLTFYVRTQKPTKLEPRMKLCINIVNKDTFLTRCVVDSFCKDPEVTKILFEKTAGDSTYMLLLIEAYAKSGGACNGEKESKLIFIRWHPKENKAIWRTKYINSCVKTITNMTKTPIADWDKKSKLTISYHRGSKFYDIFFDPNHPELGIQKGLGESENDSSD